MTRFMLWLALGACTYQGAVQLGGGSFQPLPDPIVQQAARVRAQRAQDAVLAIARTYDAVADTIATANQLREARQYDEATVQYRRAAQTSARLLAWFARGTNTLGRGPLVRYASAHDGALDEPALLANLRPLHDRAQRDAIATWDQAVAVLASQLGARTADQRTVLHQRGRPEVHKTRRETCWLYLGGADRYCWDRRGRLARHDVQPRTRPVVVARAAPRSPARSRPGNESARADEPPPADEPAATSPGPEADPSTPGSPEPAPAGEPAPPPCTQGWRCRHTAQNLATFCNHQCQNEDSALANYCDVEAALDQGAHNSDLFKCNSIDDSDLSLYCRHELAVRQDDHNSELFLCGQIGDPELQRGCNANKRWPGCD